MKKFLSFLFIFAFLFTAFLPLAKADDTETIDRILDRGVLRVGFSSFVPWAMQNKEGEYIGFEIDVAKRLASDLGVELQLIPTNWDGIIPALLARKFDIIIGGMGATPQRSLSVNFSVPYDINTMQIVTNKETGSHIKSPADLNSENAIVAIRTGATSSHLMKAQFPKAKVLYFNDEALAVQEVVSGRAHAFISAKPLPILMLAENPNVLEEPFKITTYSEPIAFAIPKNEFNTLNVLDTWVRQAEGLGWLQERRDYWFANTAWQANLK